MSDRSAHEIYHDDVHDLLDALDLGGHARPESPHEVLQTEVIPAIKRQKRRVEALEGVLSDLVSYAENATMVDTADQEDLNINCAHARLLLDGKRPEGAEVER